MRSLSTMTTVSAQTERGQAAWNQPTSPGRTRLSGRLRRVVGLALSFALVGAAWWLLAPGQLGGSTSFATVDGTSMLPTFQRSDLVALRTTGTYRVGDVAGYRSRLLERVVLHRIVAIDGGRYSFKGDNKVLVAQSGRVRSPADLKGRRPLQLQGRQHRLPRPGTADE